MKMNASQVMSRTLATAAILALLAASPQPSHWAFQPLRRHAPPATRHATMVRGAIDAFVIERLDAESIEPSGEADRHTLVRRVTLDLTGVPPTPADVAEFVNDERPDAYERLVDRLLASPHYGERWARPWLDLCHYADTDGYLTDQLRPVAWRYRQWLIEALNRDLPFDQFTIEQLAGDLLPEATTDQLIATGFLRNTLSNREGGADLEEYRVEQVVDRVQMVGAAWLGLTVGCARCHDHKFDPVAQAEFFQLYAFFDSADEVNIDAPLDGELERHLAKRAEYRSKRADLIAPVAADVGRLQARWEQKMLDAVAQPGKDHVWDRQWEVLGLVWGGNLGEGQLEGTQIVLVDPSRRTQDQADRLLDYFLRHGSVTDEQRWKELKLGELSGKLESLKKELPPVTRAPTMRQTRNPRAAYVHVRGDFRQRGTAVRPATLAVLPPATERGEPDRLTLARWLVAGEPGASRLSARVAVNRMWQEFFGRGLVPTSTDFGTQGARPSHPELLEWLASEFRDSGWGAKAMHRLIVTSATYRQSSRARTELASRDPNNVLLARQSSLRLSSDQVRDVTLAVTGLLDPRIGGPSVFPPQPPSVAMEGFDNKWTASTGGDRYRRGLYTWLQRLSPFAQGVTFDAPALSQSCGRRERSNTPLQALTLLNDPEFFEAAQSLAARLLREPGSEQERIASAIAICLGRPARPGEIDRLTKYLHEQQAILASDPVGVAALGLGAPAETDAARAADAASWTALASVLLNLHEFITRD